MRLDEDGKIVKDARRSPGALLQSGLEAMQKFLSQGELGDQDRQGTAKLRSIVTQYLTTAVSPSVKEGLGARSERELRTLAEGLDHLVAGRVAEAADIMMQRFRAVELAQQTGTWDLARHLEVVIPSGVSSVPMALRADLARIQALHVKATESPRRPSGGGLGIPGAPPGKGAEGRGPGPGRRG